MMRGVLRFVVRWLCWLLIAGLALQVFFLVRVAALAVFDPSSTSFQRSQAWRLVTQQPDVQWRHHWVPLDGISIHLQRAVIASEDALFPTHSGVDWQALQQARERNAQRQARGQARGQPARLTGGSTITQQLAKNLLLSGERTLLRKGQELLLTFMLEGLLSKERIMEIYLNHVEWGEGIFGAEAAARYYFGKPAHALTPQQAARLAVMLPAPKRFQRNPYSAFLNQRTQTVVARMRHVQWP